MAKKIKSFTVDGDAYDDLVKMFKNYGVDVSVSLYVDGCIKQLISDLTKLETVHRDFERDGKKADVPFSYIINKMVFDKVAMQRDVTMDDDEIDTAMSAMWQWNDEYRARKRGFTRDLYILVNSPLYELSDDKKYLINRKGNKKEFSVVETKDGLLGLGFKLEKKK